MALGSTLQIYHTAQVRLRNAAKARMIRWVKPKTQRLDREAPDLVKQQWKGGNKNAIADLFSRLNFDDIQLQFRSSHFPINVRIKLPWNYDTHVRECSSPLGSVREPAHHNGQKETAGWAECGGRLVFRERDEERPSLVDVLSSVLLMHILPTSPSISFPGKRSKVPRHAAKLWAKDTTGWIKAVDLFHLRAM